MRKCPACLCLLALMARALPDHMVPCLVTLAADLVLLRALVDLLPLPTRTSQTVLLVPLGSLVQLLLRIDLLRLVQVQLPVQGRHQLAGLHLKPALLLLVSLLQLLVDLLPLPSPPQLLLQPKHLPFRLLRSLTRLLWNRNRCLVRCCT